MKTKCIDVGTVNCPCPLADANSCLVCSRLSGNDKCDCQWSGVCVLNEFIQNDKIIRNIRNSTKMKVNEKIFYDDDLLTMELRASKGFALQSMKPGAFLFVKAEAENDYYYMPVSIMNADYERESICLAVKMIAGKSRKLAAADIVEVRGVYRNGLLGEGTQFLEKDKKNGAEWLIITKGIGLAPAVKLIGWAADKVRITLMADIDKICEQMMEDCMKPHRENKNLRITRCDLQKDMYSFSERMAENYDRVILLTSNFYIKELAAIMGIKNSKLVYCNNFNMCCGEGICGACCYTDESGNMYKTCKCRI